MILINFLSIARKYQSQIEQQSLSWKLQKIIKGLIIAALPILIAITFHEVSHGYVAFRLGDPTAKLLGRLTLNPLAHIDVFGTVIMTSPGCMS